MKKITAIVVIVLVTLLTFTGCEFELDDVREVFSQKKQLVLITEKNTNVYEETQNEEGAEITESSERFFYATDVNEKIYQILWENADAVPEKSVVIITYYEFQNEEVSIRIDDVIGVATCRISALSLEFADDELAVKTVLEKEYGCTDLSSFKASTETDNEGKTHFTYRLYYGNYDGNMTYYVTVSEKAQILNANVSNEKYGKYIGCVSDESIALAEERLAAYDSSKPYLTIDREGYLCLCVETIVELDPPKEGMGGCGIDHDHVFYTERISDTAFKEEK